MKLLLLLNIPFFLNILRISEIFGGPESFWIFVLF